MSINLISFLGPTFIIFIVILSACIIFRVVHIYWQLQYDNLTLKVLMIRLPSRSFENFVFQISGLQKNQDPSFIFQKDRNQLLFNFEQIALCRNTFEICYHLLIFWIMTEPILCSRSKMRTLCVCYLIKKWIILK